MKRGIILVVLILLLAPIILSDIIAPGQTQEEYLREKCKIHPDLEICKNLPQEQTQETEPEPETAEQQKEPTESTPTIIEETELNTLYDFDRVLLYKDKGYTKTRCLSQHCDLQLGGTFFFNDDISFEKSFYHLVGLELREANISISNEDGTYVYLQGGTYELVNGDYIYYSINKSEKKPFFNVLLLSNNAIKSSIKYTTNFENEEIVLEEDITIKGSARITDNGVYLNKGAIAISEYNHVKVKNNGDEPLLVTFDELATINSNNYVLITPDKIEFNAKEMEIEIEPNNPWVPMNSQDSLNIKVTNFARGTLVRAELKNEKGTFLVKKCEDIYEVNEEEVIESEINNEKERDCQVDLDLVSSSGKRLKSDNSVSTNEDESSMKTKDRRPKTRVDEQNKYIQWIEVLSEDDFDSALEQAKSEDKFMLLFFKKGDCKYCDKQEASFKEHRDLSNYIEENFVALKLYEGKAPNKYFTQYRKQVESFPTLIVLDQDGNYLDSGEGYIEDYKTLLNDLKKLRGQSSEDTAKQNLEDPSE